MTKKTPLIVAGIVFLLAALVHLTRLFTHFQIIIGTHEVPAYGSVIGLVVAFILALWMFSAAKGK